MLAERILKGDVRAAGILMRELEDGLPGADEELRALLPHTGRARVIGITGSPGAGKSTLVSLLIAAFRGQGKRVGVLAVDPSSPFSGGAILGDRIRMQEHALDPDVFIRSLATRGSLGGLSAATRDLLSVLDAMGKDVILLETVGVGQAEVEVIRLAQTVVVVLVPGMGDDIQATKAGVMEIADVFVVNKADREGADRTVRELLGMLELRTHPSAWTPPIVKTDALTGAGVGELVAALERHRPAVEQGRESEWALAPLEKQLGLHFRDRALALEAVTHRSFVHEHQGRHNERLEFLGDGVLDLVVSHLLMARFPEASEGELSRLYASLVDETALSGVARTLALGAHLRLGRGEARTGGREKPSLLADAFEAVVAVVYLEGGFDGAFRVVSRLCAPALEAIVLGRTGRDNKTALQELFQSRQKSTPRYRIISESGLEHEKVFHVAVEIEGEYWGEGTGRNKKEAEQEAAAVALARISERPI